MVEGVICGQLISWCQHIWLSSLTWAKYRGWNVDLGDQQAMECWLRLSFWTVVNKRNRLSSPTLLWHMELCASWNGLSELTVGTERLYSPLLSVLASFLCLKIHSFALNASDEWWVREGWHRSSRICSLKNRHLSMHLSLTGLSWFLWNKLF